MVLTQEVEHIFQPHSRIAEIAVFPIPNDHIAPTSHQGKLFPRTEYNDDAIFLGS